MKFEITKEELEAVHSYQTQADPIIHQLLIEHVENDILLAQNKEVEYAKASLVENMNQIKMIYTAIIKNFYHRSEKNSGTFYQQMNIAQIEELRRNSSINPFLIAKIDPEEAQKESMNHNGKSIIIKFKINETIPYLQLDEKEILLAPFTNVVKLEEDSQKRYRATLELQSFEILSEEEKTNLYETILKQADEIQAKLKDCAELDHESAAQYENIRKLEQLLATHNLAMEQENYEQDTTIEEKQNNLADIERITIELTSLKDTVAQIFKNRQENANFILDWKKNVIKYLKNELRQINEKYHAESSGLEIDQKGKSEEVMDSSQKELDPVVASIKAEVLENIAMVGTLLTNIKNLITKQQNYARIAESIDSNYKALNNAFEMRNFAEELDSLLQAISQKMDIISPEDQEELEKISKTNLQVSILLNYLNNAKAGISKKITRFDEISIIEENELKKEIAETIKNIRCEAELKKLRDDREIIEDKSNFKKLIGRFTGRNKLDATMLDQIQIRQNAIKKTFKAKMPLSYNYSIHELIAEMEMFIKENEEDELVLEEVSQLRKIKDILKKHFVIIDSKVVSIIDQKTGKNLPLASRKISKKELIEIDTYRFLNRYGYDKSNDTQEPDYQDTLANEIKRIVDYIKTSEII